MIPVMILASIALICCMKLDDMLGKFLTQFVVLVLNYMFSKFFVFAKR